MRFFLCTFIFHLTTGVPDASKMQTDCTLETVLIPWDYSRILKRMRFRVTNTMFWRCTQENLLLGSADGIVELIIHHKRI